MCNVLEWQLFLRDSISQSTEGGTGLGQPWLLLWEAVKQWELQEQPGLVT